VESSHLRVVPRTEEINLRWMILDALNPPSVYTVVAIALTNVANTRSPLYPKRYLHGASGFVERYRTQVLPDGIDLPRGEGLVLG
jgi:hypothetical protein